MFKPLVVTCQLLLYLSLFYRTRATAQVNGFDSQLLTTWKVSSEYVTPESSTIYSTMKVIGLFSTPCATSTHRWRFPLWYTKFTYAHTYPLYPMLAHLCRDSSEHQAPQRRCQSLCSPTVARGVSCWTIVQRRSWTHQYSAVEKRDEQYIWLDFIMPSKRCSQCWQGRIQEYGKGSSFAHEFYGHAPFKLYHTSLIKHVEYDYTQYMQYDR